MNHQHHRRPGSSGSSHNYTQTQHPSITNSPSALGLSLGSDVYHPQQSSNYSPQQELARSPTSFRAPASPLSSSIRPLTRPVRYQSPEAHRRHEVKEDEVEGEEHRELDARMQSFSLGSGRRRSHTKTSSPAGTPAASKRHSLASGVVDVVDEIDQKNRFVLLNARHQLMRTGTVVAAERGEDYSREAAWEQTKAQLIYGASQPRQGLQLTGGSWQMAGKAGVALPPSPALAPMATASAHIISPNSSRSLSSGTTNSSTSAKHSPTEPRPTPASARDALASRRLSLPGDSQMRSGTGRNRSSTLAPAPGIFDSIFQRVRSPLTSSSLALTEEDLVTFGMSDSQLLQHNVTQDWGHKAGGSSAGASGSCAPSRSPSNVGPSSHHSPRSYAEDPHWSRPCNRPRLPIFRFVDQVIFSTTETQSNCLRAILVLRQLSNGLSNLGTGRERLPIPRICHRQPPLPTSKVVQIEGRDRLVVSHEPPCVIVEWSDGVRDEFDPTGLTCDQILDRCCVRNKSERERAY